MIIDASVVLRALFPDEEGTEQAQALIQAHVMQVVALHAPNLLPFEVTNAALQAVRRGRIDLAKAQEIVTTFEGLGIQLHPVSYTTTLTLAHRHQRSVYDAAYMALAEAHDTRLVTGDERLYNAVRGPFARILWIANYHPHS